MDKFVQDLNIMANDSGNIIEELRDGLQVELYERINRIEVKQLDGKIKERLIELHTLSGDLDYEITKNSCSIDRKKPLMGEYSTSYAGLVSKRNLFYNELCAGEYNEQLSIEEIARIKDVLELNYVKKLTYADLNRDLPKEKAIKSLILSLNQGRKTNG